MNPLKIVEEELDKVTNIFSVNKDACHKTIDSLIETIKLHRQELAIDTTHQTDLTSQQTKRLNDLCDKIKHSSTAIVNSHRTIHIPLTKIGKSIDKNFISEYECMGISPTFQSPRNKALLNESIVEHLLRQGSLDVAKKLIDEANVNYSREKMNHFIEIDVILTSLRNNDIQPVLNWAIKNRKQLEAIGSHLEFKAHRLNIIELLKKGIDSQFEVIKYAREHMKDLGVKHKEELQHLMGCLIYLRVGIANSPHKSILDPVNYEEIKQIFINDASLMLGLSQRSHLEVAIDAGAIAMPSLLNITKIMMEQAVQNVWQHRDELPVEIDLGRQLHFHSTFSCPILKQQATRKNPPMRLACGHVISREALEQLTGAGNSSKLKCPYCPAELNKNDAKECFF